MPALHTSLPPNQDLSWMEGPQVNVVVDPKSLQKRLEVSGVLGVLYQQMGEVVNTSSSEFGSRSISDPPQDCNG